MQAIFATLAIVVLACKMAAADDQVYCYECTAGSADECIASESETITCSRVGYEYLHEGEGKNGGHNKHKGIFDNDPYEDNDESDPEESDSDKMRARFDELEKERVEIEEETKKAQAELKQNREKTGQIDQKLEKKLAQYYRQAREVNEKYFQDQLKSLVENRESAMGETIPADHALRSLKLIEVDDTIPMGNQYERANDWITQMLDYVETEENIDKASIEAFNKRFSDEWKTAYDERVEKEKIKGDPYHYDDISFELYNAELDKEYERRKAEREQSFEKKKAEIEKESERRKAEQDQSFEKMIAELEKKFEKEEAEREKIKADNEAEFAQQREKLDVMIEQIFQDTQKRLVEQYERKLGKKIPDDHALHSLKLIEHDKTIPIDGQNYRAMAWMTQLGNFVKTEKNIGKASIEAFNKRFSKEWKAAYDELVKKEKIKGDPYHLNNIPFELYKVELDKEYERRQAERDQHNDKSDFDIEFENDQAKLAEYRKNETEIEEQAEKAEAELKQNREQIVKLKQEKEKVKAKQYQKDREMNEEYLHGMLKMLVEYRETVMGEKIPADHALRSLKLIEVDDTIPKGNQSERAIDWIEKMMVFARDEKNIDKASIEAFNKRFSKEWKAAYDERVKRENGSGGVRSGRQDGKHQYLISKPSTSDNWCATFESKELGFHRGCGVVVEGYEFKKGCHPMSGAYQGVTYCRCNEDECNGKAVNEGLKLNGKIPFILMATVLVHFM